MGVPLAAAAIVGSVISAGVGAYSAYSSGMAQSAAAQSQANIAARNAEVAQSNADMARRDAALTERQAALEQQNSIRRNRQTIGSQVATTAGRGLLVDEGTALDIRSGTAELANTEAENIRQTGARRAAQSRIQAYNFEQSAATGQMQSQLYNNQAASAETGAILGVASNAAKGAASVYSGYSSLSQSGAFSSYGDMLKTGESFNGKTLVS